MTTELRKINKQLVSMTTDEWDMFNKICRSYDKQAYKGEQMFINLFEVNSDGIIIFLKAPTNNYTSLEAVMFVSNLYEHQHMRILYKRVDEAIESLKHKEKELDAKLKRLDK